MFRSRETERLVELLNKRGVSLYHACQLKDFTTYLKAGGGFPHDS